MNSIFQVSYNTRNYDHFYLENQEITKNLSHIIYYDEEIFNFLDKNKLNNVFNNLLINQSLKHINNILKSDFLRLQIMYVNSGLYLDSDVIIKENIIDFFKDFEDYDLILTENLSLYFFYCKDKKNVIIKSIIEDYIKNIISYDIRMLSKIKILKLSIEHNLKVKFLTHKEIQKYISHKNVTTK